jgi:hypothetical protein
MTDMTDVVRVDMTPKGARHDEMHTHLRGYYGNEGQTEGVLSLHAITDPGENYPSIARIIVGSPSETPMLPGRRMPDLGGFSCSPDAADRLADALKEFAAAARAAMAKGG